MERLNKILARAGLASRRGADSMIEAGRVRVNGTVVTELGFQADPNVDAIRLDGKRIPNQPSVPTYLLVYKPKGYVTTASDPEGRPTVMELLPRNVPRLFSVGRLDFQTEGLLLMTDDGDLARDLMHPSSKVEKTYRAKVRGCPDDAVLDRLRKGVPLDGKRTAPARVRIAQRAQNCWLEIILTEGRRQQVRRMLQAVGHPVSKLRRVRYGALQIGDLKPGESRRLTAGEVERLQTGAEQKKSPPRRRSKTS